MTFAGGNHEQYRYLQSRLPRFIAGRTPCANALSRSGIPADMTSFIEKACDQFCEKIT